MVFLSLLSFINKINNSNKNLYFYLFVYNRKKIYKTNNNVSIFYNKSQKYINNYVRKKKMHFAISSISYNPLYKYGCSPRKFDFYKKFQIPNINLSFNNNLKFEFWSKSFNINYLNFRKSEKKFNQIIKYQKSVDYNYYSNNEIIKKFQKILTFLTSK